MAKGSGCDETVRNRSLGNGIRGRGPVRLADLAGAEAKRGSVARRCLTVVIAMVSLGLAGCAEAGQSTPASVSAVRTPACASHLDAYPPSAIRSQGSSGTGQPMPGSPVAVVLCRYAGGFAALTNSLAVTDHARLAQLQSAINESTAIPAGIGGTCAQGDTFAIVLVVYSQGTPERVIHVTPSCAISLTTNSMLYRASSSASKLIADWTGKW